jgi:uncharacterized protein YlxW (UPF0749 family)
VEVDPLAALNLTTAERDFLRNRALLLEDLVLKLQAENKRLASELNQAKNSQDEKVE